MHEMNPGAGSPDRGIGDVPSTETQAPVVRLYYTPILTAILDKNPSPQIPVDRPSLPTQSKQKTPDQTEPRQGLIRRMLGR